MGVTQFPTQWDYESMKHDQLIFCLYVDNFGIRYFNKADSNHLLHAFGTNYTTSVDLSSQKKMWLSSRLILWKICVYIDARIYSRITLCHEK